MLVAREKGRKGMESCCLMGIPVSVFQNEKNSGDWLHSDVNIQLTLEQHED